MTMEEGTLTRWVVADGASVKRGDVIFEMETEKVQMEIEAEADGALKHLVAEGSVMHPGEVVGALLAVGEEVPAALIAQAAAQGGTPPPAPSPISERGRSADVPAGADSAGVAGVGASPDPTKAVVGGVRASPVARRLADEHGIDLRLVVGTGPDGRIVERDVQAVIETGVGAGSSAGESPAPTVGAPAATGGGGMLRASPIARRLADEHGIDVRTLVGSGPEGRIVERDVQQAIEAKAAAPVTRPVAEVGAATVAYRGRRRTTGQRMFESLASMAQLTLVSETGVDEALTMLHGLNREWRSDRIVVTLSALVVRACGLALREHPGLNARLEGEQIVMAPEVNVGVAVNQEHGLMVPVVRNADSSSLKDVASQLQELVQKSKADSLQLDDVSGGTFTITSLEGTVVDAFTPIINPPQAAILGIGRVREVAAFEGTNVVKRQVTTLSLTFDHRLNDGAPVSAFLERVEELLSRPYMLM
jgi:pyruvate dehydrogenase E2 component (dihydrolipoamide acetyltransferase)